MLSTQQLKKPLLVSGARALTTTAQGRPLHMSSTKDADFAPSDVDDSEAEEQPSNAPFESSDFDLKQNGVGEWEEMHGNYVLRPPNMDQEPRCVRRQ